MPHETEVKPVRSTAIDSFSDSDPSLGGLRDKPEYRILSRYLAAVLETLRQHYGLAAKAGVLSRKGTGQETPVDYTVLVGGTDAGYRALVSVGVSRKVMEALAERGPRREGEEGLKTFLSLVFEGLHPSNGSARTFRPMIPTLIYGRDLSQTFLTTGFSAVVPLETECGELLLQISLEKTSL